MILANSEWVCMLSNYLIQGERTAGFLLKKKKKKKLKGVSWDRIEFQSANFGLLKINGLSLGISRVFLYQSVTGILLEIFPSFPLESIKL